MHSNEKAETDCGVKAQVAPRDCATDNVLVADCPVLSSRRYVTESPLAPVRPEKIESDSFTDPAHSILKPMSWEQYLLTCPPDIFAEHYRQVFIVHSGASTNVLKDSNARRHLAGYTR